MFRRSVILLTLMIVAANLPVTAVSAYRLVEAASNADLEPPSISILQLQQNTSIAPEEPLVVRVQLVISDNNKPKTLIVNLVKDTQQYEMGYISEKENIKDIGITLTKNWPEPEIDTSNEYTNAEYNLPNMLDRIILPALCIYFPSHLNWKKPSPMSEFFLHENADVFV